MCSPSHYPWAAYWTPHCSQVQASSLHGSLFIVYGKHCRITRRELSESHPVVCETNKVWLLQYFIMQLYLKLTDSLVWFSCSLSLCELTYLLVQHWCFISFFLHQCGRYVKLKPTAHQSSRLLTPEQLVLHVPIKTEITDSVLYAIFWSVVWLLLQNALFGSVCVCVCVYVSIF